LRSEDSAAQLAQRKPAQERSGEPGAGGAFARGDDAFGQADRRAAGSIRQLGCKEISGTLWKASLPFLGSVELTRVDSGRLAMAPRRRGRFELQRRMSLRKNWSNAGPSAFIDNDAIYSGSSADPVSQKISEKMKNYFPKSCL
jgi:hypothetical protein